MNTTNSQKSIYSNVETIEHINIDIKEFSTNKQQRIIFSLEERLLFAGIAKEINKHEEQKPENQGKNDKEIAKLEELVKQDNQNLQDSQGLNGLFNQPTNIDHKDLEELGKLKPDAQDEQKERVEKIANLNQRAKNVEKAKAVLLGVLNDNIDEQKISDALATLKELIKKKYSEELKGRIIENNNSFLQRVIDCANNVSEKMTVNADTDAKKAAKEKYKKEQENFQQSENLLKTSGIRQDENEELNKAEQDVKQARENKNNLLLQLKQKQENNITITNNDNRERKKAANQLLQAERNLWTEKQKNIEIQKKAIADNINKIKSEIDKTNEVLSFQEHVELKKQLRVVNFDQIDYDTNEINTVEGQILKSEKEIIRINQSLAKSIDPIKKENDNEDPDVSNSTRKEFFKKKYQERKYQTTKNRNIPGNAISEKKTADYLQDFLEKLNVEGLNIKQQNNGLVRENEQQIKNKIIEQYTKSFNTKSVAKNHVAALSNTINKDDAIQAVSKFLDDTLKDNQDKALKDNQDKALKIDTLKNLITTKASEITSKSKNFTEQQKQNYRKTTAYDLYLPYFKNQDVYNRFIANLENELSRHEKFKVQTTNNTGISNIFSKKKNETKSIGDAIENIIKTMQADHFIIGGDIKTIAEKIKRDFQDTYKSDKGIIEKNGALAFVKAFIKEKEDLIKKNLYDETHDLNDLELGIGTLEEDDKNARIINDEYNYQHYYKQDQDNKILIYRDLGKGEFIEIDRLENSINEKKVKSEGNDDGIDVGQFHGVMEYGNMIPFVKDQTYENYIPEFQHYNNLDYPQSDYVDEFIKSQKLAFQAIENDEEKVKIKEFLNLDENNPTYKEFSDKLDKIKQKITDNNNNILDLIQIGKYRKDDNLKSVDLTEVKTFLKEKFDIVANLQEGLQPKDDGSDENVIVKELVKRAIDKAVEVNATLFAQKEAEEIKKKQDAAIKIQKIARGYKARTQVNKLKEEQEKIKAAQAALEKEEQEKAAREAEQKKKEQEKKELEKAAITGQKLFRGYQGRKKAARLKAAQEAQEAERASQEDKLKAALEKKAQAARQKVRERLAESRTKKTNLEALHNDYQKIMKGSEQEIPENLKEETVNKDLEEIEERLKKVKGFVDNDNQNQNVQKDKNDAINILNDVDKKIHELEEQLKAARLKAELEEKAARDAEQKKKEQEKKELEKAAQDKIKAELENKRTKEKDDVVQTTYKEHKNYFDNNQAEKDRGLNSVKELVKSVYSDYQKNKDSDDYQKNKDSDDSTADEDSDHANKSFNEYFNNKINYFCKSNKNNNIIKKIIAEKRKDSDKKVYIEEYKDLFKLNHDDNIDMGLKIIAANKLTKELVENGRIHPAKNIPTENDEFEGYINKHFKRFLIQMQKNPDDIKTNGQLHTFVYYRGPFFDNLLTKVHRRRKNNEDLHGKLDMINTNLSYMAKEYRLTDEMEAFLGGKLKEVLNDKINKLENNQDQNSTIDTNSQSTDSQSTDSQSNESQSNESNLSRGEDQDAKSSQSKVSSHLRNRQSLKGSRGFNGSNFYSEYRVSEQDISSNRRILFEKTFQDRARSKQGVRLQRI